MYNKQDREQQNDGREDEPAIQKISRALRGSTSCSINALHSFAVKNIVSIIRKSRQVTSTASHRMKCSESSTVGGSTACDKPLCYIWSFRSLWVLSQKFSSDQCTFHDPLVLRCSASLASIT